MKPTSSATTTPPPRPPNGPTPAPRRSDGSSFAETMARGDGAPAAPPPPTEATAEPEEPVEEPAPVPPEPAATAPDPTHGSDASSAGVLEASVESATPTGPPPGRGAGEGFGAQRPRARADALDPATRHAAQMAPMFVSQPFTPATPSAAAGAPPQTAARASMESLLPDLVKKIAWSGDGKRGSMRLELGAGALAGGTLLVHADEGKVRVELNAPTGTDVNAWKGRLEERLEQRGVDVDEVVVT